MKLMTKAIEERFAKVGDQSQESDPLVVAKFFDPCGAGTWFATEYFPEDRMFYGWVTLGMGSWNDEWGYFSLSELESVRGPLGLGIERDILFKEKPASEAISTLRKQNGTHEQMGMG